MGLARKESLMSEAATETKTLRAEYEVPETAWEKAEEKLAKLARKAKKLASFPITWEVTEEFEKEHETSKIDHTTGKRIKVTVAYRRYVLTGAAPAVAGWEFVATVTPSESGKGNFVSRVPGYKGDEVPHEYRDCALRCDHCNTIRRRKDSFAVLETETGSWKLVGRNCLADFLGGRDPHEVLDALSVWYDLTGSFGGMDLDEDAYFGGGGGGGLWRFSVEEFLSFVAFYIRTAGWVSRSAKYNDDFNELGAATADDAWSLITPAFDKKEAEWKRTERARVSDGDKKKAADALAWGTEKFVEGEARSDVEHNLGLALSEKYVTHKTNGLIAALIVCYDKHLEREIERKAKATRKNEWFGEIEIEREITRGKNKGKTKKVKPRYELELTVLRINYFESDFGTRAFVKMLDAEGRSFTWKTSEANVPEDITAGTTFTATWSVSEHTEYNGWKETKVSRPTFKAEKGGS
jgi:hypothetical protein